MLKLRIFNTKTPQELEPVQISPETSTKNDFLIGRAIQCDIVLGNGTVSREHGRIFFRDNQYHFLDLGSTNGSKINNFILESFRAVRLSINDTIHLGDFTILVEEITVDHPIEKVLEENKDLIDESIDNLQIPSSSSVVTEQIFNDYSDRVNDHSDGIAEISTKVIQYMPLANLDIKQISSWIKGKLTLKCVSIIQETNDVKTFGFITNPPHLFTYKPGQFINLQLEVDGIKEMRSYSIASSPSRPHSLEITVKRIPFSNPEDFTMPPDLISNWLYDNLVIGSQIPANGAFGDFSCFNYPSSKLLFLSAGSGIPPLMSMSRWLYDTHSDCDVIFFHSARNPQHIIYRQELEMMAGRSPDFQLAVTITRPTPQEAWLGLRGRLTATMLEIVAPDWRDRVVFVSGPKEFMQSTKFLLKSMAFSMEQYHEEDFNIASNNSEEPFATVIFNKSNKEVSCDREESILVIAEEAGIQIRNNCRVGNCGSCKKLKLEGEVQMERYNPEVLEPLEKDAGFILCCVAFPKGKVVIEA